MNINNNIENLNFKKILKIGSLNCQGTKNKADDPSFINEIKQYDIFGVNETWLSNESKNIHIEGYYFFTMSWQRIGEKQRWNRMVYTFFYI